MKKKIILLFKNIFLKSTYINFIQNILKIHDSPDNYIQLIHYKIKKKKEN